MIELRTLGSLDLRAPDGTAVASVLAQPKRLALLVYLALAASDGFARRDTLVALFWPDSDEERARAALRQAVRYLRRSLGDAAIVGRGDDEIGIAPGVLHCDAVELRGALAVGEVERALALYAGDLLPGFHVDGAPEFERWLDDQRARLRGEAAAAAAHVAERAAERGELKLAMELAEKALRIEPLEEMALRRLMTLRDRAGDRAGAIAAYRVHADRLAAELELEPSPETRALAERIRGRQAAAPALASADPAAPVAPGAGAAAAAADPASGEPRGQAPRWGRGRTATLVAAGLLALAGIVYAARPAPAAHELVSTRVLVATFRNGTSDAELDALGRMAADWIVEGVSRTDRFQVVPSTAAWATERYLAAPAGRTEVAHFREMARETGAGVVVAGAFYREGARLHFQTQLLDAATGGVLRPVAPVAVHEDSLVEGIDRLRGRVLAALATVGDTVYHLRAAVAPPSYEAYREYLAGMDAFVGGDPATALRHYQRAAADDAAYLMPRLAAAIMHLNLGGLAEADSIAAGVAAMRDRLGPLERHTLDFVLARLRADHRLAYDAMSRAAGIAPGTINEYMIAEQARILNRPHEAIRVLHALGPERGELRGWRPYWREMVWAHLMLGDARGALRQARRARSLYPNDPTVLQYEVQALAALGRVGEVEARVAERLANASPDWPTPGTLMHLAARELAAHGHDAAAERMLERSIAWFEALPAEAADTPLQRLRHATALRHAGRLAEARALLSALVAEHPDNPHYLGGLGLVHAQAGERAEAERAAVRLAAFGPVAGRSGPINRTQGQHSYLRAAIAARLGEPERAVELLRRAESEGMALGPHLRADPDLAPLRGHAAFREWIRPRG